MGSGDTKALPLEDGPPQVDPSGIQKGSDAAASGADDDAFQFYDPVFAEPRGAAPGRALEVLHPGARVGRYEIIELLESGGMGLVYRAHDPHLSRDVALELLDPERSADDNQYRARLLREARALARLSHPNVVAAYDLGTHGDAVFLARELVVGVSLASWLEDNPNRSKVLRVLAAAGRGLMAAHGADVLHRNFTPSSVMLSSDERVRVVGFGLVRDVAAEPSFAARRLAPYMAPELARGEAVDLASDQFCYAATAFTAVAGYPPYSAESLAEYRTALSRGRRAAWPRSVPARVRRVIDRGLRLRREDRYPSVGAMVDALERAADPRRTSLVVGALAIVALGSAFGMTRQLSATTCKLDATPFQNVWDAERRTALERAFGATGRGHASEAFGLLSGRLDDFRSRWLSMRQDSCEATHVRNEQAEQVLALRSACLNRKLEGFKTLVNVFATVDASMVDRAGGVTPEPLTECADVAALLGAAARLPDDAQRRAWIADVEAGYDVTNTLLAAGRWQEAIAQAEASLELARKTQFGAAIALATAGLGRAKRGTARTTEERLEAEALLRESVRLAAEAGDDTRLAQSASHLFTVIAQQNRIQEAEAMLPSADALVIRAGDHPDQRIEIQYGRSNILVAHRQFAEALEVLQEVERLAPSAGGDRRYYGNTAIGKMGSIYAELGRPDEALSALQRLVTAEEQTYGATHPRVLLALINLAIVQGEARRTAAGLATVAQAKVLAAKLSPDEPSARHIASAEGQVWEHADDCAHAVPPYRAALARYTQSDGASHPFTADAHAQLGRCLAKTGEIDEAIGELERALALRQETGATPAVTAQSAFELARALWARPAQRARALTLAEQASALWQRESTPDQADKVKQWIVSRKSAWRR